MLHGQGFVRGIAQGNISVPKGMTVIVSGTVHGNMVAAEKSDVEISTGATVVGDILVNAQASLDVWGDVTGKVLNRGGDVTIHSGRACAHGERQRSFESRGCAQTSQASACLIITSTFKGVKNMTEFGALTAPFPFAALDDEQGTIRKAYAGLYDMQGRNEFETHPKLMSLANLVLETCASPDASLQDTVAAALVIARCPITAFLTDNGLKRILSPLGIRILREADDAISGAVDISEVHPGAGMVAMASATLKLESLIDKELGRSMDARGTGILNIETPREVMTGAGAQFGAWTGAAAPESLKKRFCAALGQGHGGGGDVARRDGKCKKKATAGLAPTRGRSRIKKAPRFPRAFLYQCFLVRLATQESGGYRVHPRPSCRRLRR